MLLHRRRSGRGRRERNEAWGGQSFHVVQRRWTVIGQQPAVEAFHPDETERVARCEMWGPWSGA